MKNFPNPQAEMFRITVPGGEWANGTNNGVFCPPFSGMRMVASDGGGWDHVSVSFPDRCPTWEEMCWAKELFFRDDEVAMQLHPAKADYVNQHEFCLHLWRPQTIAERNAIERRLAPDYERGDELPSGPIPLPPTHFVGDKPKGRR